MDWATGKNVTITAYVKTIKDFDPYANQILHSQLLTMIKGPESQCKHSLIINV